MHAMEGLTGSRALVLASALRFNSHLQSLDIGGNHLSEEAKLQFVKLLSKSQVSSLKT